MSFNSLFFIKQTRFTTGANLNGIINTAHLVLAILYGDDNSDKR